MCNQVGGKHIGDFVKLLEKEDVVAVALSHDVPEPTIIDFVLSMSLATNLVEVLRVLLFWRRERLLRAVLNEAEA